MKEKTPRPAKSTLDRKSFTSYLSELIEDFGESMPDTWATHPSDRRKPDSDTTKRTRPLIFLHSGIFASKSAVFADFKLRGIISRDVNQSTLRTWWKEEFWHVKVKKWQPFAKCDHCQKYRTQLYVMRGEVEKFEVRTLRNKHREQVSLGRKRFAYREALSVAHPELFLAISIDAMDNKKTNIPRTRALTDTKTTSNAGDELKTRLMGMCG